MKNLNSRNTNVEILRFVLMCAIFLWHTYMHGFGFTHKALGMFSYPGSLPLAFFVCSILSPATYCFVFISGYYGIHFSWKRLLNMLLWTVIVALIHVAYSYYMGCGSLKSLYSSFLPLSHNRWWFITAYILLYILSPIVNVAIETMPHKQTILILAVIYSILIYRLIALVPNAGSDFIGVLFMYMLSRLMSVKKVWIPQSSAVMMVLMCVLGLTVLLCASFYGYGAILSRSMTQRLTFQLFSYCNPLVIAMAVALFYITINLPAKKNKLINYILRPSLFIYLFTQGVAFVNYNNLAAMFIDEPVVYVMWFVIIVVVSLSLGHIVMYCSQLVVNLIEPILGRVYKLLYLKI